MVGDLLGGQEQAQEVLDLPQAQAHGEGGGGQLPLLVFVEEDLGAGRRLQCGDHLHQPLVLGSELGHRRGGGLGGEAVFDLMGVLVEGLAAASGLLGLLGHSAMLTREDGRRVEDPGANR
jgi:hypothetical protein